jgi:energy-coupling factor transport system ATP-binding protein
MMSIIKTEDLEFSYAADNSASAENSVSPGNSATPGNSLPTTPKLVLRGIDMEIEKGKFIAIIGHNGSGKSTLAKHFNAIMLPSGGRVLVAGMDTANVDLTLEIRRRVGVVFQNPDNQIVATVVEEDVAFAPENLGVAPLEIRQRVDEALEIVEMSDYRKHAPHLLSGGQKQRIAIAGALAMLPQCIVFDEPTAMLDPAGRKSVIKTIKKLRDERGVTVVLITHHMDEAIDADTVIVMSEGKVILEGPPREVFKDVAKLREADLTVPETVMLLHGLKEDGFNVPLDALSEDECVGAILNSFSTI